MSVFMDSRLQTTSTKADGFLKYETTRNLGKRPGPGWQAGESLKNIREWNKIWKKKHALGIELCSNSLKHKRGECIMCILFYG